jgi:hypothetical protein
MGDETLEDFLDELRKFRDSYAERFNFDLDAICDDLQKIQRESGRKYVTLPPRRIVPTVDIPVVDQLEPADDSEHGLTIPQEA